MAPLGTIKLLKNLNAVFEAVVLDTGTACVSLEYLLVIKMTNLFPFEVFESFPNISITTSSMGTLAGKSLRCCCFQ